MPVIWMNTQHAAQRQFFVRLFSLAIAFTAVGCGGKVSDQVRDAADFNPEAYRGKVLVVNFWATWCVPCRTEIPALIELRNNFPPEEVAIVGIAVSERGSPEQIDANLNKFIEFFGVNYPNYYDARLKWLMEFDPSPMVSVPLTLIFDQKGNLHAKQRGIPRDSSGRLSEESQFMVYEMLAKKIQRLIDSA